MDSSESQEANQHPPPSPPSPPPPPPPPPPPQPQPQLGANASKQQQSLTPLTPPTSTASTSSSPKEDIAPNTSSSDMSVADQSSSSSPSQICLKLCLYGGKEALVERSYSDDTTIETIEKDMRKLFNIDPERKTNMIFPNFNGFLEKTLADFNVKDGAAITIEVIKSDGTWLSSKPRYGQVTTRSSKATPGLCGLSNMGNTCFMNSALQCLSNTPPLTDYILTDKFVDDININNPLGMHGEIARTYAELIKVMWSGSHTSFLPREFKCAVSRFAPQFNGFAQQDCQELMAFLLDGLHEDLNRIKDKPYIEVKNDIDRRPDEELAAESWSNYKRRNDSIVVDTFHAMLKSTLVCPGCQLVSVTFDPFCYLSLPLPVKREKQINLTFIPAPQRVDESKIQDLVKQNLDQEQINTILQYGCSITSFDGFFELMIGYGRSNENQPKVCKLQVPRSGPVSEIFDMVARIMNAEMTDRESPIEPSNLMFAEITSEYKLTKVYESTEHYSQLGDDCVIVERGNKYVVPLYIREGAVDEWSPVAIGRASFLHVPDLKYETLYKSIISSCCVLYNDSLTEVRPTNFENWFKLGPPVKDVKSKERKSDKMDYEDEDEDNNEGINGTESVAGNGALQTSVATNLDGDEPMTELTSNGHDDNENQAPEESEPNNVNGTSDNKKIADIKISTDGNAFVIDLVNSFGGMKIKAFGEDFTEVSYYPGLYLGATFDKSILKLPQFAHIQMSRLGEHVPKTFTPKISPKPTLQLKDCITQFANVERLGADDPWYCPKCKKHQQATKKFDIWSLPKVMIIHMKRFSYSRSWRDKIDTLVQFPVDNLDMSKYVLNPSQKEKSKLMYNLIGVANHYGGLGGGHYTAFAKNHQTNNWYSFDDALVNQTSPSNVVTRSAYVLFYQLQEEDNCS